MITYNAQGTLMPKLDQQATTTWLHRVAAKHGKVIGDVNYIFVDDQTILSINRQFLRHDYYTDHIGFDYSQGNALAGDIYISTDTVRTNADLFDVSPSQELRRVIVHGLLHLCGLRDKTPDETNHMRRAEDQALALLQ